MDLFEHSNNQPYTVEIEPKELKLKTLVQMVKKFLMKNGRVWMLDFGLATGGIEYNIAAQLNDYFKGDVIDVKEIKERSWFEKIYINLVLSSYGIQGQPQLTSVALLKMNREFFHAECQIPLKPILEEIKDYSQLTLTPKLVIVNNFDKRELKERISEEDFLSLSAFIRESRKMGISILFVNDKIYHHEGLDKETQEFLSNFPKLSIG